MFKRIGILIQRKRLEKIEYLLNLSDVLCELVEKETKSENFSSKRLLKLFKKYDRINKKIDRLAKRAKVN